MNLKINGKSLITTINILIVSTCFSQQIEWEKSYGGRNAEYLADVQPTADYGYILGGSSLSNKSGNKTDNNHGNLDYWIWKMKENGDPDWQKSFGGNGLDFLQSIKITNDGGFILAGTSNSSNEIKEKIKNDKKDDCRGGDDYWIIKLNALGNEEWQKTIGGSGQEKLKTIICTKDGGYLIGGSSSSNKSYEKADNSYGSLDYWIIKLSNKGEIEWQKTFGGSYCDELKSIEQTKDSGYIIGGTSNSPISGNKSDDNIGNNDYWIIKTTSKGEIEWQKTIGGTFEEQLSIVHQSFDEGYLLAGSSNSNSVKSKKNKDENGFDFWVLKMDLSGKTLWDEKYNIGNIDILTSLIENKDHSVLLGGYSMSEINNKQKKEDSGINDYIAIKISENGNELWRKSVGSSGEDVLQKAIETRDGGYLFTGTSNPTKSNNIPINTKASTLKSLKSINENENKINNEINNSKDNVNNLYKDNISNINNKLNDLPIKVDSSKNPIGDVLPTGSEKNNQSSNNKPIPPSKDKKTNYGSTDFWIVKIKDNDKTKVDKSAIEAFPNPATSFTNIIVGYDFESGTATLADLSGRVLQEFPIKDRTIPFDLQNLPEGIYVINIKTDKQSDGIKIIKNISKN